MGKYRWGGGSRRDPHVKPVEKFELDGKHSALRVVSAVLLLLLAAGAFTYGIMSLFRADEGWCEIESAAADLHCGDDFVLLCCLGEGDLSASAEKKAIASIYSEATQYAFRLFTKDVEYDGLHNVRYINRHPNEEIEVDKVLYDAFALIQEYAVRSIYLAPAYVQYENLCASTDDAFAASLDPYRDPAAAEYCAGIARFANDSGAVDVELLGGSHVRLKVSQEYLAFATEYGIEDFIDFSWLKNAFIADYIASALTSGGYTRCSISSCDGFMRNLDGSGETYAYNLANRVGSTLYPAARMEYSGPASLVCLHSYPMSNREDGRYYAYATGEVRTPYVDPADGLCKTAASELVCYSKNQSCAEIVLQMLPIYVADAFSAGELSRLAEQEVFAVYCEGQSVRYNDPALTLTALYDDGDVKYRAEPF